MAQRAFLVFHTGGSAFSVYNHDGRIPPAEGLVIEADSEEQVAQILGGQFKGSWIEFPLHPDPNNPETLVYERGSFKLEIGVGAGLSTLTRRIKEVARYVPSAVPV